MSCCISKEKPILLGKLSKLDDENSALTGHLGDVHALTMQEYKLVKLMDGFSSFEEIAALSNIDTDYVIGVYGKLKGEKRLSLLSEWNQTGWCGECQTYVAGDICGLCGSKIEKIQFAPPCDPWICLDEEREFIVNILNKRFSLDIPEDIFLLANNGCMNNEFFWEVAYKDKIILNVRFCSTDEDSWEYDLLVNEHELSADKALILNAASIDKMVAANAKRQDHLFRNSAAFIKEQCELFETKPLIYFSGGKESVVMYSLFDRLKISANVLTVAPGAEFPDDLEFMLEYKKKIEANTNFKYYFYQTSGEKIIKELNERKILSAKDPWCRVDFKKELKNIGTREIYKGDDFVACEGSRWYENDFRRRHPKVNFIQGYQHQVWIHPIAEWTSIDIWIYMFGNKIPINPVYYKGFQRTTCWMCPIVNPFHLRCSKKYYPELWEQIKDCKLEAFGDDSSKDLPY